jgi:hypothetical protein
MRARPVDIVITAGLLRAFKNPRSVRKLPIFADAIDSIDAKPINALLEPGANSFMKDRPPDMLKLPIEIGLAGHEKIQVVLIPLGHIGPCTTSETSTPVVRFGNLVVGGRHWVPDLVAFRGILPYIPIVFGIRLAGSALFKPSMLVTRVGCYKIQENFHAQLLDLLDEVFHVLRSFEGRADCLPVADTIAIFFQRRGIHWRDSYYINTEVLEVIELADDPLDVADSITVGVFVPRTIRSDGTIGAVRG